MRVWRVHEHGDFRQSLVYEDFGIPELPEALAAIAERRSWGKIVVRNQIEARRIPLGSNGVGLGHIMLVRMLTLLCAFAALTACSKPNPRFCDETTPCQGAQEFCDLEGVYGEDNLAKICIADPQDGSCNAAEQTCRNNETCKDEPDDGLAGICVDCLVSADCPNRAAVCDLASNTCLAPSCTQNASGDMTCANETPNTPVCGPNDRCVECLEASHCGEASKPACDTETNECRECERHAECPSGACDIAAGSCRPEAELVHVDDAGTDSATCGAPNAACATFMAANGALAKLGGSRDTIVVQSGSLDEKVTIDGTQLVGLPLTIIGQANASLAPTLGSGDVSIDVTNAATVSINGLRISKFSDASGSTAVECSGGSALTLEESVVENVSNGVSTNACVLTLLRSAVRNSAQVGMAIDGGDLAIHQSTITRNGGGGIDINGAKFEIVNSLIANNGTNGDSGSNFGGIQLRGALGDQRFEFNTVVGNRLDFGLTIGSAIECSDGNLSGSNNIFALDGISPGASKLIGAMCSIENSLIEGGPATLGNIDGVPNFVAAVDDYHLLPDSPGVDDALGGNLVMVDIDGDQRAQGVAHDMGMDEVLVQ